MSRQHPDPKKCTPDTAREQGANRETTNSTVVRCDGGDRLSEFQALNDRLSDFQQRILYILAEEARYGLAVKRALEAQYGSTVNHGRLYPNLDDLATLGLVEKGSLDDRTNEYRLTDAGREWCREDAQWRLGMLDHDPDHAEVRQTAARYATGTGGGE